jgi:RNA polymerase sigma factor (sigma-70 family)
MTAESRQGNGVQPVANGLPPASSAELLYYFCRLQQPLIRVAPEVFRRHLQRAYELFGAKNERPIGWVEYLDNLYPLDWFLASACLDGSPAAWDQLFAARAGRSDCLLTDALRARAARLYPRDEERQDSAVQEFWGHLCVSEHEGSLPILARYDGQRPLVPWLIRVFQNWHVSQLRRQAGIVALPEDDIALPLPGAPTADRWREAFAQAAREWLGELDESEVLLLGLRVRYRLSQREVAQLLQVHEGTISRRNDHLRDRCLEHITRRLLTEGWTGDDLSELIRTEMFSLLLDEPRLSADALAQILARKGKNLPQGS